MPTFRESIIETIAKYGVQLIGVGGEGSGPPFAYTIGLNSKFGVELLIVGLPLNYVGQILNEIAALPAFPELDVPNVDFTNLPVMFKRCTVNTGRLHDEYVVQADVFYGEEVDVVQIVMCDKMGRFPNHREFDHAYMDPRQPLFCEF